MRCTPLRAFLWRRGLSVLWLLFSASPAVAQPGQSDSIRPVVVTTDQASSTEAKVTWDDVVRLVDEHPRLAAGRLQIEAASKGAQAAGEVPNPTLEGNLGRGFARAGDTSRLEWGLSVTMPLGWIVQRGSRMDSAEAEVGVAEAQSAVLRREALLQLHTLFWSLAYEQARLASLESLQAQTLALARTVGTRVERGESRPVEATRVEIEAEKIASEVEACRTALGARQTTLGLWLGVPARKTLVAVVDLDALPTPMQLDVAMAKAQTTHPALKVARARTRALEAQVGLERSARVPAVNLTGFATSELDRRAYGVGLAVDVPLWNWNSGRIAQAEARVVAGRREAEATSLELSASVVEAEADCRTSLATTLRFRDNVLPRSESAASTTERTYQLGETSLLEVLDARRTLLDARRQYLRALAQAQMDCSRLRTLVSEQSP
jgi:outer membrane protein, heavy metal efflux system